MKTIKFRPLRKIKKTGKVTVASYLQWRKIKTADYSDFILQVDSEYKKLPQNDYVFNHKGENLFWRQYNPDEIPLIDISSTEYPTQWKTEYGMYCAKGLDVDGVPTFSHQTAEEIFNSGADMKDFIPLTVEIVSWWFGWFLYQLDNSKLILTSKTHV